MVYLTGALLVWALGYLYAVQDLLGWLETIEDEDLCLRAKIAFRRYPTITVGGILITLILAWPVIVWRDLKFYVRWAQLRYEQWQVERKIRRMEERVDPIPEEHAEEIEIHVE